MEFRHPITLLSLIIIPVLIHLYISKIKKLSLKVPVAPEIDKGSNPIDILTFYLKKSLILIPIILLIIALAGPTGGFIYEGNRFMGINILLLIDTSTSMRAEDFKPNRLEAAKKVAIQFIKKRQHDKIGVVIFSRDALTLCPPTLDHEILKKLISNLKTGMLEDGTALGMAISEGTLRLTRTESKSKIMILLTDGVNNSGKIDPITAASAAAKLGVKIYTIGVGSMGKVPYPIEDPIFGKKYITADIPLDEKRLKNISKITGGKYFRATDTEKLNNIYREIDKLEKTDFKKREYLKKKDIYWYFTSIAIFILLLHLLINEIFTFPMLIMRKKRDI